MSATESTALKVQDKKEIGPRPEQLKPGPTYTPAVDIFETEKEIIVLADMPGVKAKDLTIDLRDSTLTLSGDVTRPEGENEVAVLREYQTGKFLRSFTLSEVIDQSGIEATLRDGVLRLTLPKVAPAVPRKITVKTG